jgi:hypothetical protein
MDPRDELFEQKILEHPLMQRELDDLRVVETAAEPEAIALLRRKYRDAGALMRIPGE